MVLDLTLLAGRIPGIAGHFVRGELVVAEGRCGRHGQVVYIALHELLTVGD